MRRKVCCYFHFPVKGQAPGSGGAVAVRGAWLQISPISIVCVATVIPSVIWRVKVTSFSLRLLLFYKCTVPFWEVGEQQLSKPSLSAFRFRRDGPAGRWRESGTPRTWSSRSLPRRPRTQTLPGETPPPPPRSRSRRWASCAVLACVSKDGLEIL